LDALGLPIAAPAQHSAPRPALPPSLPWIAARPFGQVPAPVPSTVLFAGAVPVEVPAATPVSPATPVQMAAAILQAADDMPPPLSFLVEEPELPIPLPQRADSENQDAYVQRLERVLMQTVRQRDRAERARLELQARTQATADNRRRADVAAAGVLRLDRPTLDNSCKQRNSSGPELTIVSVVDP
jgi:hypothetical protein